jgi:hypothetical protein
VVSQKDELRGGGQEKGRWVAEGPLRGAGVCRVATCIRGHRADLWWHASAGRCVCLLEVSLDEDALYVWLHVQVAFRWVETCKCHTATE